MCFVCIYLGELILIVFFLLWHFKGTNLWLAVEVLVVVEVEVDREATKISLPLLMCWWFFGEDGCVAFVPPIWLLLVLLQAATGNEAFAVVDDGDKQSCGCCRLWNGIRFVRIALSGLLLVFIFCWVVRPYCFLHLKAIIWPMLQIFQSFHFKQYSCIICNI